MKRESKMRVVTVACLFCALLAIVIAVPATDSAATDLHSLAPANEQPRSGSQKGNATVPLTISSQIADAAAVKFLLLDRATNIVGLGWNDRENANCGQTRFSTLVEKIIRKYGYKTSGEDFFDDVFGTRGVQALSPKEIEALERRIAIDVLDTPAPLDTSGALDKDGCSMWIKLPEGAYRIIIWPKGVTLPDVEFSSGTLGFSFNSPTVSFSDGTKCSLKGRTYFYSNGAWREK